MLYKRKLDSFTTTSPLLYSLDNTSPHLTTSHPRNVNSSTAETTHPWKVLNPFHVAEPGPNQFWSETSPSDDPRVLKPPIRGSTASTTTITTIITTNNEYSTVWFH